MACETLVKTAILLNEHFWCVTMSLILVKLFPTVIDNIFTVLIVLQRLLCQDLKELLLQSPLGPVMLWRVSHWWRLTPMFPVRLLCEHMTAVFKGWSSKSTNCPWNASLLTPLGNIYLYWWSLPINIILCSFICRSRVDSARLVKGCTSANFYWMSCCCFVSFAGVTRGVFLLFLVVVWQKGSCLVSWNASYCR